MAIDAARERSEQGRFLSTSPGSSNAGLGRRLPIRTLRFRRGLVQESMRCCEACDGSDQPNEEPFATVVRAESSTIKDRENHREEQSTGDEGSVLQPPWFRIWQQDRG